MGAAVSVAVDGRPLADASSFRGLGTYLRLLLGGLGRLSGGTGPVTVSVLVPPGVRVPAGVRAVPSRRWAPDRFSTLEHHLRLPGELRRIGADVVHSPALDPPGRLSRPWVQTVADVLPLALPHPDLGVEARRWERWAARVRRADAVVTFSRHGAGQAAACLGVAPERIHVVPLAADPRYRPGPAGDEPGRDRRPYFLYVGEYGPHKGFADAARLMAEPALAGLPHRLLMAGRIDAARRARVEAEISSAGRPARRRVEPLGWVPDLLPLYRGATALVVTSHHEGFGLPAVEAMACGTPVVAFDNSATAEVVAGGGRLVPDGDTAAMAEALAAWAGDDRARAAASRGALRAAGRFDWAETVRRHVEVYRAVAGS